MHAIFDYKKFPIVIVTFGNSIDNIQEFNIFLKQWLNLYYQKKDFIFIFDTRPIEKIPNIKYCILLSLFIKKLKSYPYQYLKKSYMIINKPKIKNLLDFIFLIQSPVSEIEVTNEMPTF